MLGQAANGPSQPQPEEQGLITHTSEITTDYFHCQENCFFYPELNHEVVQVTATVPYANTDCQETRTISM
jgi:hypothetical protein